MSGHLLNIYYERQVLPQTSSNLSFCCSYVAEYSHISGVHKCLLYYSMKRRGTVWFLSFNRRSFKYVSFRGLNEKNEKKRLINSIGWHRKGVINIYLVFDNSVLEKYPSQKITPSFSSACFSLPHPGTQHHISTLPRARPQQARRF